MSMPNLHVSRVDRLAEEALYVVGDVKEFMDKDLKLIRFLVGLRDARQLQVASAQGRVEQARASLRAAEADLYDLLNQDNEADKVEKEIIADFELEAKELSDIARIISADAKAIGYKHTRPELVDCSPSERATV